MTALQQTNIKSGIYFESEARNNWKSNWEYNTVNKLVLYKTKINYLIVHLK